MDGNFVYIYCAIFNYLWGLCYYMQPLDHCVMHARRPAAFTVSGPFQIVPTMDAYLFGRG